MLLQHRENPYFGEQNDCYKTLITCYRKDFLTELCFNTIIHHYFIAWIPTRDATIRVNTILHIALKKILQFIAVLQYLD